MQSPYPFLKDARLVVTAITAPERRKELADVWIYGEVGVGPLNYIGHFGILGPKALTRDVIDKIDAAARKAVEDRVVRKRLEDSDVVIIANSPEQFAAEVKFTSSRRTSSSSSGS